MRQIDQHNSTPSTYTLGMGPFTDLTFEEFTAKYLSPLNVAAKAESSNFKKDQGHMDWRKSNDVSEVKDQ